LDALIEEKNKNGLVVLLNCVITRNNLDQVPEMLEFCHSKKLMMAAIFAQNPNPSRKYSLTDYNKNILFSPKDAKRVTQIVDYLIQKKQSGYQLAEPIRYYEGIKQWLKEGFDWQCDAGLYSMVIDTDGAVAICGYLPFTTLNISDLPTHFLADIKNYRKKYLTWCTKKCLPSCMFCASFYRQHPGSFLYSKLRYR
jgi:MoaA/NifB/PqqE/SkfB family radical SAM enzyme